MPLTRAGIRWRRPLNGQYLAALAPLLVLVVLLVLLLPIFAADAQGVAATAPQKSAGGELPPVIKGVLRAVLGAFEKPVHPILAGVAPGGGFGAGVGVDVPVRAPWTASVKGLMTLQHYWIAETEVERRGDRAHIDAYARLRDMPQLAFYGIGNETDIEARSNFGMRDGVAGAFATVRVAPWVTIGARAEENWTRLGRGHSSQFPTIEDRFDAGDVPGMTGQGKYARYDASVDVRVPAAMGEAFYQGARYRVTYAYFDDQLTDRFTFTRLDLEAQQRFAMPIAQHRLTLHAWMSSATAGAGQDVPFYLQRTLGGKSFVRSVRDDIIGSDGSDATLRGFGELRFRDRNLLLMQAEYRIPIWALFDATVYVDAGKVTPDRSELDFSGLRHNLGFSLNIMKGAKTVARYDLAFGGGEGYRMFFTVGRDVTR